MAQLLQYASYDPNVQGQVANDGIAAIGNRLADRPLNVRSPEVGGNIQSGTLGVKKPKRRRKTKR